MGRDVEGPIQEAIVGYLRAVMPQAIVHHCRNEINKRGQHIARELAKAKKRGAVTGFPDIIVLPYASATAPVMFFEVKAPKGSTSPAQKAVHAHMGKLGHKIAVVRSIDDVRDCLILWGVGFVEKLPVRGEING